MCLVYKHAYLIPVSRAAGVIDEVIDEASGPGEGTSEETAVGDNFSTKNLTKTSSLSFIIVIISSKCPV